MLNSKQQEVVLYSGNELLVLAGAGSGKTRCVTEKVKLLLEQGYNINEIVAITFTNKAADEMVERISTFKKIRRENTMIGTFHSFCYKIIKNELQYFGLPRVRICTDDQVEYLIKEAIEAIHKDPESCSGAASKIDKLKNRLIYPDSPKMISGWIRMVYEQYEDIKHRCMLFDFGDLIAKTTLMLQNNGAIREKYQKMFKYIIVDEFQDVNHAQFELVKVLHNPQYNKLMVVGDDSQCVHADTMINLKNNKIKVSDINKLSIQVLSYRNSKIVEQKILHCDKTNSKWGYKISTKNNSLMITPNHKIWATNPILQEGQYFVYLMYRKDFGYRVGISKMSGGKGGISDKFSNSRANGEGADKLWILEICDNLEDALFKEYSYSLKYSVPTCVFNAMRRGINQDRINKIFNEFGSNGEDILNDKYYDFNYPHWEAGGVIRIVAHTERYTHVCLEWSGDDLNNALDGEYYNIINNVKRIRKHFSNYRKALEYAKYLKDKTGYSIVEKLGTKIGTFKIYTASQLFKGMKLIAIDDRNNLYLDEITSIEKVNGDFYDLDIDDASNFFGNNILSHNSIYGFRDSDPSYIINFSNAYPMSHTVKLEQNYRSSKKILQAANIVINKNMNGLKKELWTENHEGELISVRKFDGDKAEAKFIADTILKGKQQGKKYSDFCVLYRSNSQSRNIEDALALAGIPSQVVQGVSFYDRMEVKDIMSYLRFIDNPNDLLSFRRCVQTPKRGIGQKAIDSIMDESKEKGITVLDVMKNSDKTHIKDFYNLMSKVQEHKADSMKLIQNLVNDIGYAKHLETKAKKPNEVTERMESIGQIQNMVKEGENQSLSGLLDFISLRTNADDTGNGEDKVRLSTVHSAKGLEFDTVFIIGMNKGTFPHEKMDPEIEEARRLFYVAITRAKRKLYISHTDTSTKYGTVNFNQPSSFLSELPNEVVEKNGGQNDFSNQRQSSQWQGYSSRPHYFQNRG